MDSKNKGWVKIHRKIFEWDGYQDRPFNYVAAWVDLLLLARYDEKPETFYVRHIPVTVERGQLAWTEERLGERWGWSRTKVRLFLERLKKIQQIRLEKSAVISKITIIN